jgi:peptidoglycan/xylan/chitin deacetylase (PgdA/CDA1 family)
MGRPDATSLRGVLARSFRGPPAAGVAWLLERLAAPPPGGFAALTYHRVDDPGARPWLYPFLLSATPEAFDAQMAALLRRHRPIGLPDLLAASRGARPLPRRAVLVTFDDAYRDFVDNAWPILQRRGIPATLFVPTAFPDARDGFFGSFWWDRVWQAVQAAPAGVVHAGAERHQLADDGSRRLAARALVEFHKGLPHDEAMTRVAALTEQLGGTAAGGDILGWDDLRRLAAEGVHIAPHSRTHPLLTRLEPDRVADELHGSREDLDRQLAGRSFGTVFAYPAGQHDAANRTALAQLGFELAFTTERGINQLGHTDPLRLRRINVGMRAGPALVRAMVAFLTLRYRSRGV